MLTKDDLQAIDDILDTKLDKKLNPIESDIKSLKHDMQEVQKDIRVMLAMLDRADVLLRQRVERIEEHLEISFTK
jgi:septal ring factor EnvC (AmiA/AmiB activator)